MYFLIMETLHYLAIEKYKWTILVVKIKELNNTWYASAINMRQV